MKRIGTYIKCCHTYEHDIFVIFVVFLEINLLPRENNAIIVPFKYISLTIATAKALLFASRVVFGYRFTFGIVPSLLEYGKKHIVFATWHRISDAPIWKITRIPLLWCIGLEPRQTFALQFILWITRENGQMPIFKKQSSILPHFPN